MQSHYVLTCPGCGAPAADCVRICPYCGTATQFPGLEHEGIDELEDGTIRIGEGAHVVLGPTTERVCPFCGATNASDARHCAHCKAKVVVERLRVSRLVVSGGMLSTGAGAQLEVVGRAQQPIHRAARTGDLELVKSRVTTGSDPDLQDDQGRRPLHYAADGGHVEVARWLISVGADPAARDDQGNTPRDRATNNAFRQLLQLVGA